ncbi:uncharacterized protein LOC120171120 [Hibiscus syriacus]|uniref:uncharacterized protein LOC120171120 n=1 Tax=Hibiscus syriacus TaxID=106335 RepID=UPI0019217408|nr:uncharacterized protein LOC120171120 [Hibiscus syriacus]
MAPSPSSPAARIGLIAFTALVTSSCLKVHTTNTVKNGHKVSPILGLLAYNADSDMSFGSPFELGILAIDKPIKIDFSNVTKASNITGFLPLCAAFEGNGKVTLKNQVSPNDCVASRHGQFGGEVAVVVGCEEEDAMETGGGMLGGSCFGGFSFGVAFSGDVC